MWPNLQLTTDLVTFTEENVFFCAVIALYKGVLGILSNIYDRACRRLLFLQKNLNIDV